MNIAAILAIAGQTIAAISGTIIRTFLTQKIVMRVVIHLMDYLVKSSKNSLDDSIWADVRTALEKELG